MRRDSCHLQRARFTLQAAGQTHLLWAAGFQYGQIGRLKAEVDWLRDFFNLLTLVVNNVTFKDGKQVQDQSDRSAA